MMPQLEKRIDVYIDKAQPFAHEILIKLRELVHKGCPELEEKIKWGMPSFDYKGPMCHMAAFKHHCVFGFWKAKLIDDPDGYMGERSSDGGEAMGNMGRITSLKDLPPDKVMIGFIIQAKNLNEEGVKLEKPTKDKKDLVISDYFINALKKNKKAQETFDNFSYSHRKEYVEWVTEAKTGPTREKRMNTTIEWLSEGKSKNWKYIKK